MRAICISMTVNNSPSVTSRTTRVFTCSNWPATPSQQSRPRPKRYCEPNPLRSDLPPVRPPRAAVARPDRIDAHRVAALANQSPVGAQEAVVLPCARAGRNVACAGKTLHLPLAIDVLVGCLSISCLTSVRLKPTRQLLFSLTWVPRMPDVLQKNRTPHDL